MSLHASQRAQRGLSLIELMIAMVIGLILTLGLIEIFSASRSASRMAEGLGRVQENGRFAIDFLQRDLRMVGHVGCVNDQARDLPGSTGLRNLITTAPAANFAAKVEGFEAAGSAPGSTVTLGAAGTWSGTPALPVYLSGLNPAPVAGSDIVLVRFFSARGIPVLSYTAGNPASIRIDKARWDAIIASDGYGAGSTGLLGLADCVNAATLQATTGPDNAGNIAVSASGLNSASLAAATFTPGQTMLYRAEIEAFYVARNAAGTPSLYRARFTAGNTGGVAAGTPEELVEGIESLQIIYGTDNTSDLTRPPSGYVATQDVARAATVWPRVGLIQVGLVARSSEPAAAAAAQAPLNALGTAFTAPADGRYRTVYSTTIALRNRLFGN